MNHAISRGLALAALTLIAGAGLAADVGVAERLQQQTRTIPPGATRLAIQAPRMVVENIYHWPKQPEDGDNVVLYFRVSNKGLSGSQQGSYILWVKCYSTGGPQSGSCPFPKKDRHPLPAIAQGQSHQLTLATLPWPAGDYALTAWVRKTGTGPGTLGPHQQHHGGHVTVAEKPGADSTLTTKPGAGTPSLGPARQIKPGRPAGFNPTPVPPPAPADGFAKP